MVSYEEFKAMLEDAIDEQPEYCFRQLNSGIMLEEETKLSPAARNNDLFILGQYCRDRILGRYVVLYYGSFCRVYGNIPPESMGEKIRHVLRHELTHHVESLAGDYSLEEEDAAFLARYQQKFDDQ